MIAPVLLLCVNKGPSYLLYTYTRPEQVFLKEIYSTICLVRTSQDVETPQTDRKSLITLIKYFISPVVLCLIHLSFLPLDPNTVKTNSTIAHIFPCSWTAVCVLCCPVRVVFVLLWHSTVRVDPNPVSTKLVQSQHKQGSDAGRARSTNTGNWAVTFPDWREVNLKHDVCCRSVTVTVNCWDITTQRLLPGRVGKLEFTRPWKRRQNKIETCLLLFVNRKPFKISALFTDRCII